MRMVVFATCVCGLMAAGATRADAQMSMGSFRGYLTAHAGATTGGDVSTPGFTPGVTVSVQEESGWGAEFDFGYAADLDAGRQQLDVATYMFNGNWIERRGRVRPFVAVGAGVIQADGCDFPCSLSARTFDLGINAGGGALFAVNDLVAVRGDARYFRTLGDHPDLGRPDNFGFWRVSVGVSLTWVISP